MKYRREGIIMADEILALFTGRSLESCLEVGGTRSWKLDRAHAKRCQYAVLCRNASTDWGDGKEPHGTAFMIGHIADVLPMSDEDDRWLVTFDQYARINVPNVWKGWRNPVRYTTFEELGVSLQGVVFHPMPTRDEHTQQEQKTSAYKQGSKGSIHVHLTIAQAKQQLAQTFGVSPDAIEITIRG